MEGTGLKKEESQKYRAARAGGNTRHTASTVFVTVSVLRADDSTPVRSGNFQNSSREMSSAQRRGKCFQRGAGGSESKERSFRRPFACASMSRLNEMRRPQGQKAGEIAHLAAFGFVQARMGRRTIREMSRAGNSRGAIAAVPGRHSGLTGVPGRAGVNALRA